MIRTIQKFIQLESSGGIILFAMAMLALLMDNSPLRELYNDLLTVKLTISLSSYGLSKPLVLWINDGLMAIFFLLVGAEIKREFFEGELNTLSKAMLPSIGAIGGMIIPALIYVAINYKAANTITLQGWAIPTATDIAFALGVLTLLGSRVPSCMKIFLTALAIMDDLGAIVIIALFYTANLSGAFLWMAGVCLLGLWALNRKNIVSFMPYSILGVILWFCVLKSGVHATLAGVAVAFAYPLRNLKKSHQSPIRDLEERLHPWVVYGVLPLFAFANAGLPLQGLSFSTLLTPVPLGIILGLFLGKQIGIFGSCWLAVKTGLARLPEGANWHYIYGVSLICGIGFTMSLFIGTLAFSEADAGIMPLVRLGVLSGSLLAGTVGYGILRIRRY
ncbi:MAG: Na+/H+ antiporter NhaA [Gammaproteobacteria bacterium]